MVSKRTLERLDFWNQRKFDRYYTIDTEQELTRATGKALDDFFGEHSGLIEAQELVELKVEFANEFRKEEVGKKIKTLFSQEYSKVEMIINNMDKIFPSKGVREEYAQPFIEQSRRFTNFVEEVEKSKVPPQEQTDESLDQIFRVHFTTLDNYLEYSRTMSNTMILITQPSDDESRIIAKYLFAIARATAPILTRTIMGPIYSDKTSKGP